MDQVGEEDSGRRSQWRGEGGRGYRRGQRWKCESEALSLAIMITEQVKKDECQRTLGEINHNKARAQPKERASTKGKRRP